MKIQEQLERLSDDDLIDQLKGLVKRTSRAEAELVAYIGEADARRLYLRHACPSMFVYCTELLHLSEGATYMRIGSARAARRFPVILDMLADGRLHVSGVRTLASHLTEENYETVLARATHCSKREVEELVAELSPKPDVPSSVRAQPAPETNLDSAPSSQLFPGTVKNLGKSEVLTPIPIADMASTKAKPAVEPLAPRRYKVQFTASKDLQEKFKRLEDLMKNSMPPCARSLSTGAIGRRPNCLDAGDLADFIEAAVTDKIERLEAKRLAKTDKPRKTADDVETTPKGRYIPAPIRREVSQRDGNRCTFVSKDGRRCSETRWLEFHHDVPFARGGEHSPEVLRMLCRAHNVYQAEKDYGQETMRVFRRPPDRVKEPRAVYASR